MAKCNLFNQAICTTKDFLRREEAPNSSQANPTNKHARLSQIWAPLSRRLSRKRQRVPGVGLSPRNPLMLGANCLLNETSLPSVPSDIPSDSSLGPDRIPYSGWKAAGEAATITLHSYGLHLINGSMLLANFNDSTLVFAPEGAQSKRRKRYHPRRI